MIIIMRFLRRPGPYCRDCGLATYREMTSKSLLQGWWGLLSVIINPIVMLTNLAPRRAVAALPPPVPGAPRMPLNPGKPMIRRPAMLMLLLPVLAIVALVVFGVIDAKTDPEYSSVGDCVYDSNVSTWSVDDEHPNVSKVSCSDSRAQAQVVAKVNDTTDGKTACAAYPSADSYYYYSYGSSTEYTLCLRTLK
jgi:hypothetical protein